MEPDRQRQRRRRRGERSAMLEAPERREQIERAR
jgi:hypothetical protein